MHEKYRSQGGTEGHRTRFMNKINDILKEEIHIFNSPGLVPMIIHKTKASTLFNVIQSKDDDSSDEDEDVINIAKKISTEIKSISPDNSHYSPVTQDNLFDHASLTLKTLLSNITPKLESSLSSAMICSIVTSEILGSFTPLQLSLGLLINEKSKLNELYKYRITANYNEIRRFKISAAITSDQASSKLRLDANNGLIQYISDNFDAQINSQNGLKQTHGLASIVTQPLSEANSELEIIPRAPKTKVEDLQFKEINKKIFSGQKKPPMPLAFATSGVLPLKVLCQQVLGTLPSRESDFHFFKNSVTVCKTPDYNGYCTKDAKVIWKESAATNQNTFPASLR